MSIVLNEREWAASMIERSDLGKKPFETLTRAARMYMDDGFKQEAVRKKLLDFIIRSTSADNINSWGDIVASAIKRAKTKTAIQIEHVVITKSEMTKIDSLDGKPIRRLAFTLLCLAKYWDQAEGSGGWVRDKDSEIMQMANVATSIKRQSAMYHTLMELGLIQFSRRVDNTNVRVCFMDDGEPEMYITDFRNLGYQYLMHHGEPYFVCRNCGLTTRLPDKNNRRGQKYCKSCAAEIAVQQKINAVMRQRHGISKQTGEAANQYTVYMHECPNGKRYVGTTATSLEHRWKQGSGYDGNSRFSKDIRIFGWNNIKHYVILSTNSHELAKTVESLYIKRFNTTDADHGYNRSAGDATVDIGGDVLELYPAKSLSEN